MKKGITLSSKNIDAVMRNLKSKLDLNNNKFEGLILPMSERVLNRNRYRGTGRPRTSDYDHKKIEWHKIFKGKLTHPLES